MKFEPIIKWTGSKRSLSEEIIKYFPKEIDTFYEPFCGSCSITFQLLHSTDININNFVCSDLNKDLINYFNYVKNSPEILYESYKLHWNKMKRIVDNSWKVHYYNFVRTQFNKYHNPEDFIFLNRTCFNGLVRYNSKGEFNTSFHHTRDGIEPETLKRILNDWSEKLNKRNVNFIHQSYIDINPIELDFIFLDPPYANTTGMYMGTIDLTDYWKFLNNLSCKYCFTFDGKSTLKDNTYNVPDNTYNQHVYLTGYNSAFKKLQNVSDKVSESLYLKL